MANNRPAPTPRGTIIPPDLFWRFIARKCHHEWLYNRHRERMKRIFATDPKTGRALAPAVL